MNTIISSINRKVVIENLSSISVKGNEDGLIPAFGVFVNQLPASFWNAFGERITRTVSPEVLGAAEELLVNCAHECGYHTGYGIINSDEWKAVVAPMVKTTEDVLHGAFAVFTAWGWAKSEIVELIPSEKMIVRAYDYYESDIVKYGKSTKYSAYMLRGVCGAFMELAYGGNYPNVKKSFQCEQSRGIECGDDYGEFIVTPK
jgi:hypothetical protein